MNIVAVAPIGLLAKAGYSFIAAVASLKKISTAPLVTDPNANGAASGTVKPRVKPSVST